VFETIRRWKQKRILATSAIPEPLWREALEALPFLAIYTEAELARLRQHVVLFLSAKSIVAARDFQVTPLMRVMIAIQACVLTLNLGPHYYDGWENVVVYPDEFITGLEYEDEAGVVHRRNEPLAGEAVPGGPVILSWPDVEASTDWSSAGMNLVIHEFAHKIDMRGGEANGCPPLHPDMPRRIWQKTMAAAYEHFRQRMEQGEETEIDPYAAESPAEFFAVLSEIFFVEPTLLQAEYPAAYRLFAQFYRQDPGSRTELLLEP
jgi:Mlc titration factor MtfA (ptsG expression regulator)